MTQFIGPFRKSSHSMQEGNCLEVAPTAVGSRAIRDSKDQASPILTVTPDGWQAFLAGAKAGEFDLSTRS
ncbi:DUF397 domain-containing protein [Streptomyces sp. NBC_00576]|uniref:DUF397 domain-containing protein n=1 Tax=Streptomyces sp. NBC_00576 TaxID=2903665 RepID=UPI002E802BC8|nr:DUF397 domain-containing protein [Streptomyces sp. NBC_00576]WUB73554.1 DUF397 domain-containing protein [Streptomyces sp. NBC_00576]